MIGSVTIRTAHYTIALGALDLELRARDLTIKRRSGDGVTEAAARIES